MIKELGAGASGSAPAKTSSLKASVSLPDQKSFSSRRLEVSTSVANSVQDAISAAPGVSLAYASLIEISPPLALTLTYSPSRPIILTDTGSALVEAIAKELAKKL